jgi:hypothetical protein
MRRLRLTLMSFHALSIECAVQSSVVWPVAPGVPRGVRQWRRAHASSAAQRSWGSFLSNGTGKVKPEFGAFASPRPTVINNLYLVVIMI